MNPLRLAQKEWPLMLAGSFASVVLALASGLLPLLCIAPFLEKLARNDLTKLNNLLLLGAGLIVLASVALYCQEVLFGLAGARFGWRTRQAVYTTLLNSQLEFSQSQNKDASHTSSGRVGRAMLDVGELTNFFSNDLGFLVGQACIILVTLWLLVSTNASLTALLLVVMLPIGLLLAGLGRSIEKSFKSSQHSLGVATGTMSEGLSKLEIIKAFVLQNKMLQRFAPTNNKQFAAAKSRVWVSALHWPVSQVAVFFGIGLVLFFATGQISAQQMKASSLIAYLTLVGMAIGPLQVFSRFVPRLFAMRVPAKSLAQLLALPAEPDDEAFSPPQIRGEIVFEHVRAHYRDVSNNNLSSNDSSSDVLTDFSLSIAPGSSVALVGASGGGKSTVLRLLLRLLPCVSGQILLDGRNINHYSLAALRGAVALVPQQPMLFSGSLRENLLLAKPGASDAELLVALEAAGLAEEVLNMPSGLGTMLGENAAGISGGQAQRLAIARALLLKAPILVLDEPTSALDSLSEAAIKRALENLRGKCTVIVIAHRLSTVEAVDRIVVLRLGQIVESGSHNELKDASGPYAELLRA